MEAEWGDVVRFLTYLAEEREIVLRGRISVSMRFCFSFATHVMNKPFGIVSPLDNP